MSIRKSIQKRPWLFRCIFYACVLLSIPAAIFYMTCPPGQSYQGPLLPIDEDELGIRNNLQKHVFMLSEAIGERNLSRAYPALQASAMYISEQFRKFGYQVVKQPYSIEGKMVENIEVEKTGKTAPEEILIIGAHYDSPISSPGANDNASGVGALLELARIFSYFSPDRTIRFVAFVNEEAPYCQTPQMGAVVYAKALKKRDKIIGMISLETIGYYSDEKDSQHYPVPFDLLYPDTGNFIAFVGNLQSRSFMADAIESFRSITAFPSEGIAAPGWIKGIGWSDHWAFWEQGYPAIMITDTALFRYPFYHLAADTWKKIDYGKIARVVKGLGKVIHDEVFVDGK